MGRSWTRETPNTGKLHGGWALRIEHRCRAQAVQEIARVKEIAPAGFIRWRRHAACNYYAVGGYRVRKVYNIDMDNKMQEELRDQTDRIVNTWNVIKS